MRSKLFEIILFLCIIILGLFLRIYSVFLTPIAHDELATADFTKQTYKQLWESFKYGTEPFTPYYYMLIKFLQEEFFTQEFSLRIFSLIPGILILPIAFFLSRILQISKFGSFCVLCIMAIAPTLVHYSRIGRVYSLFYFLTLAAVLLVLKINSIDPKTTRSFKIFQALYVMTIIFLFNSHYFGLVFCFVITFAVFLFNFSRTIQLTTLFSTLLASVLYDPWWGKFFNHFIYSKENLWLNDQYGSLSYSIYKFIKYLTSGRFGAIDSTLAGFVALHFIISSIICFVDKNNRNNKSVYFLLFCFWTPIFLVLIKSFFGQVAFHPRYLMFVLPLYIILIYKSTTVFSNLKIQKVYSLFILISYLTIIFYKNFPYWGVEN